MKIMPARTYEELCELKQSGKITWLQFVEMSEHADDFHEWCEDHGVEPDDNYAELFLEETETLDIAKLMILLKKSEVSYEIYKKK